MCRLSIAILLLVACGSEIKAQMKIPELGQLENITDVLDQRNEYKTEGGKGILGFDEVSIKSATLAGEKVFLVQQAGELIEPIAGRIRYVSTISLWNTDMELIVSRSIETNGKKQTVTTFRWQDGKLTRKVGRKKVTIVPTKGRPQADEDVQVQVGRINDKDKTKGTLLVLDHERSRVIENEFEVKDKYEFEWGDKKFPVTLLQTSREGGTSFYFGEDNKIYLFELEKLRLTGGLVGRSKQQCRRLMVSSPLLQQPAVKRIKAGWKGNKQSYRNAELGVSLRLPEGWHRLDKLRESIVFVAESGDRRASLVVAAEVVGKAFDTEEYAKAFRSILLPKVLPRGQVELTDIKTGNRKAKELAYKRKSGEIYLAMRTIVIVEKEMALRIQLAAESGREGNFKKDFADILRILRFEN